MHPAPQNRDFSTTLRLRPSRKTPPRVLNGHPWVFAGEVEGLLPPQMSGKSVAMRDAEGRWLGMGIYNSHSQIVWRRYTQERFDFDSDYTFSFIKEALIYRNYPTVGRLIWSEADYLPGLVVDRFEDVLVVQALTMAVDQRLEVIASQLKTLLPAIREIVFRNDAPTRTYEGLPLETHTLSGNPLPPRWYTIDGVQYWLDLEKGQKTGFYLDQRMQHVRVAEFAKDRVILDGFCNQGGFALQAAKKGAKSVIAVDSSEACIAAGQKNAAQNGLTNVSFQASNMFDFLAAERDQRFDLIVLDPPSFARNRTALEGAMRGYKELNLRALKLLRPGGILATYVCSHPVTREMFHSVVTEAAADARRSVRLIEETGQPLDHPILLTFPESAYLKGMLLQV